MKRVIVIALGASAVAALAAGCGSSTTASTSAPPASSTPAPTSPPATSSAPAPASPSGGPAVLKAVSSSLGQILADGSGRTLYLFKADTGTSSTCNGTCALAWPPDTTVGHPNAAGLTAAMVGTTTRSDGSTEVTYNGHPLYYFAEDTKPGDTKGQGVNAFGGAWYVVSPSGSAVAGGGAAPAPSTPAPTTSKSGGGYGY